MIPLIISRLIEQGWRVYIPLHRASHLIIQHPSDSRLMICGVQTVSQDKAHAPIVRSMEGVEMVGASDVITKTVWIIPQRVFEGKQVLRLGERYEEFIIPEPSSLTYQEQKKRREEILRELKETARAVGSEIGRKEMEAK